MRQRTCRDRRKPGYSLPGLQISGLFAFGLAQNNLWRDTKTFILTGAGANQYVSHGNGAGPTTSDVSSRLLLTTSATTMALGAVPTSGNTAYGDTIDVRVNGVYYTTAQFPDSVGSSIGVRCVVNVNLPAGFKTVELIEQGCFLTDINIASATIYPAPTPVKSFYAIGASGTRAFFGWDESNVTGGMFVFDLAWRGRVTWSGRFDGCYCSAIDGAGLTTWGVTDNPSAIAFVSSVIAPRMTGTVEKTIWLEFGAGEYLNAVISPTTFATNLGFLCDAIHAAFPSARVYLQTPIIINSPTEATVNGLGFLMQDYRNVYPALVSARPGYCTLIKGYNGGAADAMSRTLSDLSGDGKHMIPGFPGTHVVGHVQAWNYIQPLL